MDEGLRFIAAAAGRRHRGHRYRMGPIADRLGRRRRAGREAGPAGHGDPARRDPGDDDRPRLRRRGDDPVPVGGRSGPWASRRSSRSSSTRRTPRSTGCLPPRGPTPTRGSAQPRPPPRRRSPKPVPGPSRGSRPRPTGGSTPPGSGSWSDERRSLRHGSMRRSRWQTRRLAAIADGADPERWQAALERLAREAIEFVGPDAEVDVRDRDAAALGAVASRRSARAWSRSPTTRRPGSSCGPTIGGSRSMPRSRSAWPGRARRRLRPSRRRSGSSERRRVDRELRLRERPDRRAAGRPARRRDPAPAGRVRFAGCVPGPARAVGRLAADRPRRDVGRRRPGGRRGDGDRAPPNRSPRAPAAAGICRRSGASWSR